MHVSASSGIYAGTLRFCRKISNSTAPAIIDLHMHSTVSDGTDTPAGLLNRVRELGLKYFTTTLASSRWKSIEQITAAGLAAEQAVSGTMFWAQNWRKGGLSDRRNQLLREYGFYNQQYCGCEFSMRQDKPTNQTE